ncbi:DODA-type extradiol aromatic ring-opening family dioxygenase [Agrobacterium vitis]|uniref:DODA-type extradiol aromatic ring-opening family dioxygenase n=1 Tax=Agrobacterium vitis TaxID=373 RepID=UPI0015DB36DC|nr:class III extradiol ring-cleavage dioxygenase [Agrobacterium vitis]MCF1451023.1 dioxygenase [Agrobacterium vitis]BCH53980.1 dioxygenase [Agrobacterium vitis]
MTDSRLPVYFIPHGGGPWPFMEFPKDDAGKGPWDDLAAFLRGLPADLGVTPKTILIVSGHWEKEPQVTVSTAAAPGMLYDYYGFPAHTYEITYPAKGDPALAAHVRDLLQQAGIPSAEDDSRGFDHGVFVPLMVAYPDANVPVVMLSLKNTLDAESHLEIGKALQSLRDDNVLIIASGMSYHNMPMFRRRDAGHEAVAKRFDDWLTAAVEISDPDARAATLSLWNQNPDALACHVPDHDHLVPLFVAAGAAGADKGVRTFNGLALGKAYSGYRFG